MQYVCALYRLLREILFSNLYLVQVYLLNTNGSSGLYCIALHPQYAMKLGLVLPSVVSKEDLVTTLITLTMGWINYLPLLCIATEMVTDLENSTLRTHTPMRMHKYDQLME